MAGSVFLKRAVNNIPKRKPYCFWQCQCRDRRKASTLAGITELSEDLNSESSLQTPLPSALDTNLFIRMERSRNRGQKILSRSVPFSSFPTLLIYFLKAPEPQPLDTTVGLFIQFNLPHLLILLLELLSRVLSPFHVSSKLTPVPLPLIS